LRAAGHVEFLTHTGQHYDYGMSQIFFEELGIPEPDVNLEVGSGSHGWQTGQILMRIEEVLLARNGLGAGLRDTNSTLAGAGRLQTARLPGPHRGRAALVQPEMPRSTTGS